MPKGKPVNQNTRKAAHVSPGPLEWQIGRLPAPTDRPGSSVDEVVGATDTQLDPVPGTPLANLAGQDLAAVEPDPGCMDIETEIPEHAERSGDQRSGTALEVGDSLDEFVREAPVASYGQEIIQQVSAEAGGNEIVVPGPTGDGAEMQVDSLLQTPLLVVGEDFQHPAVMTYAANGRTARSAHPFDGRVASSSMEVSPTRDAETVRADTEMQDAQRDDVQRLLHERRHRTMLPLGAGRWRRASPMTQASPVESPGIQSTERLPECNGQASLTQNVRGFDRQKEMQFACNYDYLPGIMVPFADSRGRKLRGIAIAFSSSKMVIERLHSTEVPRTKPFIVNIIGGEKTVSLQIDAVSTNRTFLTGSTLMKHSHSQWLPELCALLTAWNELDDISDVDSMGPFGYV